MFKRRMGSTSNVDPKDYPFGMYFHVEPHHKFLGTAFGTMLWLWIFWRAKNDGKALLVRECDFLLSGIHEIVSMYCRELSILGNIMVMAMTKNIHKNSSMRRQTLANVRLSLLVIRS